MKRSNLPNPSPSKADEEITLAHFDGDMDTKLVVACWEYESHVADLSRFFAHEVRDIRHMETEMASHDEIMKVLKRKDLIIREYYILRETERSLCTYSAVILFFCRLLFWGGLSAALNYSPLLNWILRIKGMSDFFVRCLAVGQVFLLGAVLSLGDSVGNQASCLDSSQDHEVGVDLEREGGDSSQ